MKNTDVLKLEVDLDGVWTDILGPTHEIRISRAGLDVGTLTATVLDSVVDPASVPDIKPGISVRLQAYVDSAWTNVYAGRLHKASATYRDGIRVTLEAVDDVARMANSTQKSGVATITELSYILSGDVLFNVNGSGVVGSGTLVNSNDNASLLDQVILTRDTNLGYAWVDRNNVLQVWDNTLIPTTVQATFSDVAGAFSYSDIDVAFDTGTLINNVTINVLAPGETGETEQVVYGPYPDLTSYSTWGPHSAQFTVHGPLTGTEISDIAAAILNANSTPTIRVNSLTTPIRSTDEVDGLAALDLYDYVSVTHDGTLYNNTRITSVEHEIRPDSWRLTLGFEKHGVVTAPQRTPAPTPTPVPAEVELSDGLPPVDAAIPAITEGIGTLFVTWDAIANADPVTYDVYISSSTGFTPDNTTLAGSVMGTMLFIAKLPNGDPLDTSTTYYVRLGVRDVDGAGPISGEVTGTPSSIDLAAIEADLATLEGKFPITTTDISDGAITTPKMTANSIDADRLIANSITGAKIAALTITADKIAANAITADKIAANAITTGKIAADAITANELSATAIDGMTITGVVYRSAASGQRTEIRGYGTLNSANEILFYDGSPYETQPGYILSDTSSNTTTGVPYLGLGSPEHSSVGTWINLVGGTYAGASPYIQSGGGTWTHNTDFNCVDLTATTLHTYSGISTDGSISADSTIYAMSNLYTGGELLAGYGGSGSARISTNGSDYWPQFWGYRNGGYGTKTAMLKLIQTAVQVRTSTDSTYETITAYDFDVNTSFSRFKENIRPVFPTQAKVVDKVVLPATPLEAERPRDIIARNGLHTWTSLPDKPENATEDETPKQGVGLLADTMPDWMIAGQGYSLSAVAGFLWEALKEANERIAALEQGATS